MQSLVDDTSPQLGGNLDSNEFDIEINSFLSPQLFLSKTSEDANEKRWLIEVASGYIQFKSAQDDTNTGGAFLKAVRLSGTQISHIEIPTQIQAVGGNANVPAYSFKSDPDTGMYLAGASELGFSTDNQNRLTITNASIQLGAALDVNDFEITNGTALLHLGGSSSHTWLNAYGTFGGGSGADLFLRGGPGATSGGDATISGGDASAGVGGQVKIEAGSSTTAGGHIYLEPGLGSNSLTPGQILIVAASGSTSSVKVTFYEGKANGSNYITLKAPDSITDSRIWTLPQDDPSVAAGKFLTTNGSGVLSFDTPTAELLTDTTPQLGGDLNVNGSDIVSDSTNSDIVLTPYGTGEVKITEGQFTSTVTLSIEGNLPEIKIVKTNEPVDEKIWAIAAGAGYLGFGTINDAGWSSTQFMRAYRGTGTAIDYINFYDPIQGHAGTVGNPGFTFYTDTDTGMYRGGTDILRFATAGTERLEIEADGTLNVAGTANYEALVTADDDIPNKKYVDDNVGISEVLDDLSPQLGGTLDMNGYDIGNSVFNNLDIVGYYNTGGGGGRVNIKGGGSTTNGGHIYLDGGAGPDNGGNVNIKAGTATTGNGGDAYISGGHSNAAGGRLFLRPGIDLVDGSNDGYIVVDGGPVKAPLMRFYEASGNGAYYIAIGAPDDIAGSVPRTWRLPDDDPTVVAGHFLTTNSSGELSFIEGLAVTDSTAIIFDGDIYCDDLFTSGDTINVGGGEIKSDGSNVELYYAGVKSAATMTGGLEVHAAAGYGHVSITGNDIYLWNTIHAGKAVIYMENSSGQGKIGALFNPDGASELYYAGVQILKTTAGGIQISDGANVSTLDHTGVNLALDNSEDGGLISLRSNTSGGTPVDVAVFDPDGAVEIFYAGAKVAESTANGITGAVWG